MRFLGGVVIGAALAVTPGSAEDMQGFFRGAVAGFDGTKTLGVLRARDAQGGLFSCGFDSKSYFELEKHRVTAEKLLEGDPIEVVAYRRPKDNSCYILTLTVVPPPKPVRPTRRLDMSPPKQPRAPQGRRGSETAAGVVTHFDDNSITIRTRDGEQTFLLRRDTRFLGNGLRMEREDVAVNQHLAVEWSRNLDGELEAFQLTWGDLSVH